MIRKELRRKVSVYGVFLITFLIYGCGKKEDLSVEGTSDVPVMMEVSEQEELSWYVPDENTKYFLECDGTEEEITSFVNAREEKGGVTYWVSADLLEKLGYSVIRDTEEVLELKQNGHSLMFEKDGNHYLADGVERSLSEAPELTDGVLVLPLDALYGLGYQVLDISRYSDSVLFSLSGQE